MNQNLMNPEIVIRSAQEREMELRRAIHGLNEVEGKSGKPAARQARGLKLRLAAFLAGLFA